MSKSKHIDNTRLRHVARVLALGVCIYMAALFVSSVTHADVTTHRYPDLIDPSMVTVAAKQAELGTDVQKLFDYVRDQIRYRFIGPVIEYTRCQWEKIRRIELRGCRAKFRDIETLDQRVHVSSQLNGVSGTQPRHQRQQCHRFDALFAQIAQRQCAKTLRKRLALRTRQQRMMSEGGHIAP